MHTESVCRISPFNGVGKLCGVDVLLNTENTKNSVSTSSLDFPDTHMYPTVIL